MGKEDHETKKPPIGTQKSRKLAVGNIKMLHGEVTLSLLPRAYTSVWMSCKLVLLQRYRARGTEYRRQV